MYGDIPTKKPLSIEMCDLNQTITNLNHTQIIMNKPAKNWYLTIFNVSYYWFSFIAVSIVFLVGITVSLLTEKDVKPLGRDLWIDITNPFKSKDSAKVNFFSIFN